MKTQLLSIMLVLALVGCARANLVDSNSIFEDGIECYIQTNKSIYDLGEDVEFLYRITNLRSETWEVFASPLRDIRIAAREGQDFNEIWRLNWFRSYPPGPRVLRLQPGESSEINVIWPQIDCQGTRDPIDDTPVPPGIYRVSGVLIPTDTTVAVDINIVPEPSSLVLFVGGLLIVKIARLKEAVGIE